MNDVDSFIPSDLGALPLPNEILHLRVACLEDRDEVDALSSSDARGLTRAASVKLLD